MDAGDLIARDGIFRRALNLAMGTFGRISATGGGGDRIDTVQDVPAQLISQLFCAFAEAGHKGVIHHFHPSFGIHHQDAAWNGVKQPLKKRYILKFYV